MWCVSGVCRGGERGIAGRRWLVDGIRQLLRVQQRRCIDQEYSLIHQRAADAMQIFHIPEGQGAQQECAFDSVPGIPMAHVWAVVLKHLLQVLQQNGFLKANSRRQHRGK